MANFGSEQGSKERTVSWAKAPVIALPKGGGAIRGIGEKFGANPVTGAGSLQVPIATSPGRGGFGPALTLNYDSSAGNGPFGWGWHLDLPSITRKTDKGLPRYVDSESESDVFILSGSEDLVPTTEPDEQRTIGLDHFRIRRYRPRIEGLFARIERWTNASTGETHWRSISAANITTIYGRDAASRISDPPNPAHVFSWLISESYDDKGNAIVYAYKAENSETIDLSQAHEANRTDSSRAANRYVERIKYGNLTSRLVDPDLQTMHWMFEVVFDYGEDHVRILPNGPQNQQYCVFPADPLLPWPVRQDPFSSYRGGFEVRTYRLCRRVLMVHHIEQPLGVADYLVSTTDFHYDESPIASFITRIVRSGYVRQAGNTYLKKSLPALEFEYSEAAINTEVVSIDSTSLEQLPVGVDGTRYQPLDLNGDGLMGVFSEHTASWFFKPNLSPLPQAGNAIVGRFAPAQLLLQQPSLGGPAVGRQQFLDLAGDGHVDLVELGGVVNGFYERTPDEGWAEFVAFASVPNVDLTDPNVRFIDLTGNGRADILITEDDAFVWYPSRAEDGYSLSLRVQQAVNEDAGPKLLFADGTDSIYLADLSGDGLTDLVRIRNGEVCYWPNLGYGRFGTKVTMDRAPCFDAPDLFDQQRIRLGDIDGSGTTDIFYLGTDAITIWRNESGNGWTAPFNLTEFPRTDSLSSVTVIDLLGSGTACLVWSSTLPNESRPMRYIDLMGGQKPHLLVGSRNNLGAETRAYYCPSTRFYLEDRAQGRPWVTRLAFPVHVVERVETYDHVSGNRFVTRYRYRHGYFDGSEREFRGFGMVEQLDTEELAALQPSGTSGTNLADSSYVPPVLTRTWFHTGAFLEGNKISRHFEEEYYHEPGLNPAAFRAQLLDDTVLPDGLSAQEVREACRSLKGSLLRQEIYALDSTAAEDQPYTVTERNYTVKLFQARAQNRNAVFFVHEREAVEFHYERTLYHSAGAQRADPRVSHGQTLAVDDYGNVLCSAGIAYGRRFPDSALPSADQETQNATHVTFNVTTVTDPVSKLDDFRAPLACETRSFQLLNCKPKSNIAGITNRFGIQELHDLILLASDGLHEISYEDVDGAGVNGSAPFRRLIEHSRTRFRRDDLTDLLPLTRLEARALPGETYTLALTPGLLNQLFVVPGKASLLELTLLLNDQADGGYVHSENDAGWWIPSGRVFYSSDTSDSPAQELARALESFFLPGRFEDTFGQPTRVWYDTFKIFPAHTEDAAQNVTLVEHDYRVLQPWRMTDANGNRSQVAFDALALVVGTAVNGKIGDNSGDSLDGFVTDLDEATLLNHIMDPLGAPHAVLAGASTRLIYDLFAYQRSKNQPQPDPAVVYTLTRETHAGDLSPGQQTRVQHSFSYSDGLGREIQRKIQAEPGPLEQGGLHVHPRWAGTGWTVFNNKGKSVRKYEPFFSATHRFELAKMTGVSPVFFYDPVGRLAATLHPDHTWEKVLFDPWRQEAWDRNDTALIAAPKTDADVGRYFERLADADYLPTWYTTRSNGTAAEQDAAQKVAAHADTPAVTHLDSLGRSFLTVADNGAAGKYTTRFKLDIEGNQRRVIDARGRVVMTSDYDMLGTRIHQASMESGERWLLNDVIIKPIMSWDSRGHRSRIEYDALRRALRVFVRGSHPLNPDQELLAQRLIYGEQHPEAELRNLRGRLYLHLDQAGAVAKESHDFKGNVLQGARVVAREYKQATDWSGVDRSLPASSTSKVDINDLQKSIAPFLEDETYTTFTTYDALNRPVALTTPHTPAMQPSVVRPGYNEANLLDRLEVNLRGAVAAGAAVWTPVVTDVDYNEKGLRTSVSYGNGAHTTYEYDPQTFRLTALVTARGSDALQDLRYTYDSVGNITSVRDGAQQTIYFRNAVVSADTSYEYDAVYRLIRSEGREHIGQTSAPQTGWNDEYRVNLPHPNDGQAMRRYSERYDYDEVGNILQLVHHAMNGNWTRQYTYAEPSLLESWEKNNRLTSTTAASFVEQYSHDKHGNMTSMPHLARLEWDFEDQLQSVDLGGGGEVFFVYDAAGQRVRKVCEKLPGLIEERIYLGGFEIFRRRDAAGAVTLERESLHVMDEARRLALVETRTAGSDGSPAQLIRYQLSSQIGSVALELDENAQVISYEEYHAYGSTSYQAGRSSVEVSLKRYRFTGKERDVETGLSYLGVRYYAPWLTRWTSADPSGIEDHVNSFLYVRANPISFVDHTGTETETPALQPAPTGSAGHPLNDLADVNSPRLKKNWERAVHETLKPVYKGKNYEENITRYRAEIARWKPGSKGPTAGEHARILFDKTLAKFKQIEKADPSFDYREFDAQGRPTGRTKDPFSDPEIQVHHKSEIKDQRKKVSKDVSVVVKGRPEQALDLDNLRIARGGPSGGQPVGTTHHQSHHGEGAKRQAKFRVSHGEGSVVRSNLGRAGQRGFATPETLGVVVGGAIVVASLPSEFRNAKTPEERLDVAQALLEQGAIDLATYRGLVALVGAKFALPIMASQAVCGDDPRTCEPDPNAPPRKPYLRIPSSPPPSSVDNSERTH